MRIEIVGDEDNVGLLIHDHFGNASLALKGRLDGGPARPSEGAVGACRRFFHLSKRGGARKYHHCDCQNQSRLELHPHAPFIRNQLCTYQLLKVYTGLQF